jgi:6-phosphogluconolactonase
MRTQRRHVFQLLGVAVAFTTLAPAAAAHHDRDDDDDNGFRAGKVFTSTNAPAGNELLIFDSGPQGLTLQTRLATQGIGTGTGLGNQGAVTLSRNGRYVFVVNAGSNTVSTFAVRRGGVQLVSTVDSGGLRPISVAEHDGLVYVLNAAGAGNVAGFRNHGGELHSLPASSRPLSAAGGTGPAQVGFGGDGDALIVTEKATNKITTYRVQYNGLLSEPRINASAGTTPFGFAVDRRGHLLVSEAFGGAAGASALSSYGFSDRAPTQPVVISASVPTTQSAACWVVTTPNGRHAYVTNTGSNTISQYRIGRNGQATLVQAVAGASATGPIDAAVSNSGRALYVLNGRSGNIAAFGIAADGALTPSTGATGLPVGSNGLAAN